MAGAVSAMVLGRDVCEEAAEHEHGGGVKRDALHDLCPLAVASEEQPRRPPVVGGEAGEVERRVLQVAAGPDAERVRHGHVAVAGRAAGQPDVAGAGRPRHDDRAATTAASSGRS